jgi:long-chain acyl-CoA synthetase
MLTGMKCGFFAGNMLKLTEDIQVLKPTFFISVPRLYNRIYGKVQDKFKAATGFKGWLINRAVASKSYYFKNGDGVHHRVYDALVFNRVKAMLGGKVRFMLTGSAPIAPEVLDFLKICFCCDILEGYGMTESSAGSFTTILNDTNSGSVGGPIQNVKFKLKDIPEMGYLHTNNPPKGEVCMKGSSIMTGYFLNPEKTKEAFTHDGWLLTGDVGMVLPNGSLKIVDRAKNIFKLSQGEYIAPEKLENTYIKSKWVAQTWIYGDSLRDYIIGFFCVDPENTLQYCDKKGKTFDQAFLDNDKEFK